jgi:hypothetical protein
LLTGPDSAEKTRIKKSEHKIIQALASRGFLIDCEKATGELIEKPNEKIT